MATQDHKYGSIYVFEGGTKKFSYDFTNQLSTGETVASCLASAYNTSGQDVSASIVTATSVTSPAAYVTVGNGIADRAYEVKIRGMTSGGNTLTGYVGVEFFGSVSLNAKMGEVDSNSYVNLEEATSYIKNMYGHSSNWDNLTFEGKKRVLIQAANDLELLNYKGRPYYVAQSLSFPRNYHETHSGAASVNTATSDTVRGLNLYSSTYNVIPDNFYKYGTVHMTGKGPNFKSSRYIQTSTASKSGGYGEVVVSSPFSNNVVASDSYLIFLPLDKNVKDAQCEQAIYIADNRYREYSEYNYAGIGYVRTGDLGMSFKNPDNTIPGRKIALKARKLLGRHARKTMRYGRA